MSRSSRTIRPSTCVCCSHSQRAQLEALRVGGASLDALAERFDVSRDSIYRHFKNHVSEARRAELMVGPARMAQLANAATDESRSLLEQLSITRSVLFNQFLAAAEAGDRNGVATISRSLLGALENLGRVTGELRNLAGITFNVNVLTSSPEFVMLQRGLLDLCRRHPAARDDVIALLRNFDDPALQAKPVSGPAVTIEGHAHA